MLKREHTTWGARKIRERLLKRFSGIPIPAKSTIHAVLDRLFLAMLKHLMGAGLLTILAFVIRFRVLPRTLDLLR